MSNFQPPEAVVQRQLDAYNAKDLPAWVATYAPDAKQFALGGAVLAEGREAISARAQQRFAEPDLNARLLQRVVMGQVVVDHEALTRTFADGPGTVELVCVYLVDQGHIQSATFHFGARLD
jgi:putative hydrolase of HD superfamily